MELVTLNNGIQMPVMGYGVYKITDPMECEQAVFDALEVGYRSIDTAQFYQNEEAVGRAMRRSSAAREEIFLTTKIWISDYGEDKTEQAVYGSLRRLQTDHLDLVLIHQPFGDYYGAYRALQKLYRKGIIRAIGVSNFYSALYLDLVRHMDIIPAVNQVEAHVFHQQAELIQEMKSYGTALVAWGPLAQGKLDFFTHPELKRIGGKYGKTNSQIGLRYLVQQGMIVIPKTVRRSRMLENMNVFDFELSAEDMRTLQAMDTRHPITYPHYDARRVKKLLGMD